MKKRKAPAPKPSVPPLAWLGIALCVFLIFGDTKGCNIGGTTPTFPVAAGTPVAVAIAAKFSDPATVTAMTKDYPGVIGKVQSWVKGKGGKYRGLDVTDWNPSNDAAKAPNTDEDWVKAAWKVIDKANPPRIIGATPSSGLPDQPLPKTTEEVDKLLSGLLK
jgi:hypothetical protein